MQGGNIRGQADLKTGSELAKIAQIFTRRRTRMSVKQRINIRC